MDNPELAAYSDPQRWAIIHKKDFHVKLLGLMQGKPYEVNTLEDMFAYFTSYIFQLIDTFAMANISTEGTQMAVMADKMFDWIGEQVLPKYLEHARSQIPEMRPPDSDFDFVKADVAEKAWVQVKKNLLEDDNLVREKVGDDYVVINLDETERNLARSRQFVTDPGREPGELLH